jgi:hypothetical protein
MGVSLIRNKAENFIFLDLKGGSGSGGGEAAQGVDEGDEVEEEAAEEEEEGEEEDEEDEDVERTLLGPDGAAERFFEADGRCVAGARGGWLFVDLIRG